MADNPPSPSPAPAKPLPELKFAPFMDSTIDDGFWHRFSALKLDTLRTDDSPLPITGFYAPCSHRDIHSVFTLLAESLPEDPGDARLSRGNRNRCPVPGTLYNANTFEGFRTMDRSSVMKMEAKKMLEDFLSGRVEEDPALLSRFVVISFADLKKHNFWFLFGFPALVLRPPASLIKIEPALAAFTKEEAESVAAACNEWRSSSLTSEVPFFLVSIEANSHASIRPLKDLEICKGVGQKLIFGFYDTCKELINPGWPLRNFLTFICLRWKIEKIRFFCYREKHGFADLGFSLVGEALVSVPKGWREPHFVPEAAGWERNKENKLAFKGADLAQSMDPERLANSAADLNLKLMKWRALPSLNLDVLYTVKCLVLGAGALGCQVARMLMAWGVRKITLVDSGRVSLSNPLNQSLYVSDNSLNGGDVKVVAAARRLKSIFPAVEVEGIALEIPMPGCHIPSQNEARVFEDCKHLQTLITSHDVIFLMTDTRESCWLPSLLCASENKIAIRAALEFDNYLVMRHGTGPTTLKEDDTSGSSTEVEDIRTVTAQVDSLSVVEEDSGQRLGCCFCKSASLKLNQKCLVSRPGLAPIASALAVELMVGILHHPDGMNARAEVANSIASSTEQPLGMLPHQIQGSLPQLSQLVTRGYSSNNCTACCSAVVSEYRIRGMEFILQAINDPTYFENIESLRELVKSASSYKVNLDKGTDGEVIGCKDPKYVASCGEESNSVRPAPLCINLPETVDPGRLVVSAADLNLSLMKHALPSLNLSSLINIKCLLLGAGTLGCQVARMLMAWGVRKITFVDKGKVAMSNPVRQSLYTFEDCLKGGAAKAIAAATRLKQIIPSVDAEGIGLAIPMPGHPISPKEEDSVLKNCKRLETLISSHDVVFLLTDTRESRWLPSLLCASQNKIAINAALGFDSYLVMRHGAGPVVSDRETSASSSEVDDSVRARRLGCYFCNDVVAPIDSVSNRTLDQQCTVTRPGLAPIASALAVEMMVGILHHPNRIHAPGEIASSRSSSNDQPLGLLPHQIRGSLSQFSQMTLVGHSSDSCTACCSTVVSEYKNRGDEFLVQAINHPTYLEDLTGLTALKEAANAFEVDWDDQTDDDEDIEVL